MSDQSDQSRHDVRTETATFAAGCFWGVEDRFRRVDGVVETRVGYTGGHAERPSYQQVCSGTTGHAEAVEVVYDPEAVSYDELVRRFWELHDPTQVDRQGPDVGSQYRSAIFTHDEEQARIAKASREELEGSGSLRRPVATEIVPAGPFWEAEEYHQQYFQKQGIGPHAT